ncbi:MAG: PD40 domain-containing protein [Anaerolineales bacterium]|nr:PD40 domain-containing protein [Anaerolineales bacterium]
MPWHFTTFRSKTWLLASLLSLALMGCNQNLEAPPATEAVQPVSTDTPIPTPIDPASESAFLSIEENGYAHLFLFRSLNMQLTRITTGSWSDIAPALNPQRTRLAFASDRDGDWDLYVMALETGEVKQVTNTPQYDSAPSWSPDGQWLAFETYVNDNLEIAVVNVDSGETVPLTQHPASDHSPAWAPDGRNVAFISTRGGDSDVWLANLDLAGEDRYKNLSNTPFASENFPLWNRDGSQLLWSSISQTIGYSGLYAWNVATPDRNAYWIGDGNVGSWNEAANRVLAAVSAPNQTFLTSYDLEGNILFSSIPLTGRVRGIAWGSLDLPAQLPETFIQAAADVPAVLWAPIVTPAGDVPNQRFAVVPINDVQAPFPQLHDLVDESYNALRLRISQEAGWDALASLENAFVPLTTSLEPGMDEDWLYTGRAFAINSLMANAGWMVTLREDIGAQTYWHVYIRCAVQDGSMGEPIHNVPWNLNARYDLDPRTYEQGGDYAPVPAGYWVDVTSLAYAYGWERLPALPTWRTYYKGARFTTFAATGGLTWYQAMQELYPVAALTTPTRVLAPSLTPTNTPTLTPTIRPTRTPRNTPTPVYTPTITLTPSETPFPTLTPTPPTVIPGG